MLRSTLLSCPVINNQRTWVAHSSKALEFDDKLHSLVVPEYDDRWFESRIRPAYDLGLTAELVGFTKVVNL